MFGAALRPAMPSVPMRHRPLRCRCAAGRHLRFRGSPGSTYV